MSQDLRSYLDLIKQNHPEDFLVVSREVDPAYEITAIAVKLEQEAKRRPILLFEKVKGTKFPVLTNLHAGRSRLATAINAKPEEMQRAYLRAMEKPIRTKDRLQSAGERGDSNRRPRSIFISCRRFSTTKKTPARTSPRPYRSPKILTLTPGTAPITGS